MSVYIEVTKHRVKCHLQAWKSLVLLEKAFKILKTMLVFKSNFTMHGLRKHLPSKFEYLETIPQTNNHGHIFDFLCLHFQFFRAFYIIVLGIYMNMLFVFQQNNIYCICSVFSYIFSDNEFVRFYRVRKIYVQLIKPWMTLICAGTLYLLLIWCQTFSVQT